MVFMWRRYTPKTNWFLDAMTRTSHSPSGGNVTGSAVRRPPAFDRILTNDESHKLSPGRHCADLIFVVDLEMWLRCQVVVIASFVRLLVNEQEALCMQNLQVVFGSQRN